MVMRVILNSLKSSLAMIIDQAPLFSHFLVPDCNNNSSVMEDQEAAPTGRGGSETGGGALTVGGRGKTKGDGRTP